MEKHIEVFKTSISKDGQSSVSNCLIAKFPDLEIHIDMEDCDKVLRIEGQKVQNDEIIATVKSLGFHCEILA